MGPEDSGDDPKDAAWTEAKRADAAWGQALRSHQLAPPDSGFGVRLQALADAARRESAALWRGVTVGLAWRPVLDSRYAQPPYELRPRSSRRGPEDLWERFDAATRELNEAGGGDDLRRVAAAFGQIADVAAALASAVDAPESAER